MKCRSAQVVALLLSVTTTMSAQGLTLPSAPSHEGVDSRVTRVQSASRAQSSETLTPDQIGEMYRDGIAGKDSKNAAIAAHARNLLQWHDVLTAKTAAERHAAIRRLPVTLSRTVSDDGVTVDFISGGKSRVRLFEPTNAAQVRPGFELGSGPSAVDSGEQDECYPDDPCATQEELEDAATVVASAEADRAAMEADFNQRSAAYCSIYSCDGDDEVVMGGPSAAGAGCWLKHFEAGLSLAGAWAYLVFAQGTVANPPTGMVLTRSGVGALIVGAFAVGYTAGTAINAAYECYMLAAGLDQFAAPACPARLPN